MRVLDLLEFVEGQFGVGLSVNGELSAAGAVV